MHKLTRPGMLEGTDVKRLQVALMRLAHGMSTALITPECVVEALAVANHGLTHKVPSE